MPARKRTTTRKRTTPKPIKRGPGDASLSITIDGALYRELRRIAAEEERTLAGLVRHGLRELVEDRKVREKLRREGSRS